jgi:hypothetical protein
MCLFPTLVHRCLFCKCLSIVLIPYGVAGGQCVDIVLLQALLYMVTLKHSDLFKVIVVYFGLLF